MSKLDPGKFDNDPEPYGGADPTDEEIFARLARIGVPPEQIPEPGTRKRYTAFINSTKASATTDPAMPDNIVRDTSSEKVFIIPASKPRK
jgi:hypothetical protein